MMKRLQAMVISLIIVTLLTGGFVFGEQITKTAELFYNNIKIYIDGEEIIPKDANGNKVEPFTMNGTTYLPVRAISNALGANVQWDPNKNAVIITSSKNIEEFNKDAPVSSDVQGETVYVGKTGSKYHYKDCRTLKDSVFPISLSDAEAEGRTPCKVCHK